MVVSGKVVKITKPDADTGVWQTSEGGVGERDWRGVTHSYLFLNHFAYLHLQEYYSFNLKRLPLQNDSPSAIAAALNRKPSSVTRELEKSYEKSEERWAEYSAKTARIPLIKRVYVDESGVHASLQREYARASRGKTIEGVKRGCRFERVNAIDATCKGEPFAIECCRWIIDGTFFERWFKGRLFSETPKGHTTILDNARFHRKTRLRKLSRGKVRLLFPPPYSPDYNPIEKPWADMKRLLSDNLQDFQSIDSDIYDYFNVPVN